MQAATRMSYLVQEESTMLREMRIRDLPKLQDEKIQLGNLLEAYQRRLASDPDFIKNTDDKTREELLLLTDDLAFEIEDSFRHISVAHAVNQRVLQAIMDVVSEDSRPGTYGRHGQALSAGDMALSMNLNQKA